MHGTMAHREDAPADRRRDAGPAHGPESPAGQVAHEGPAVGRRAGGPGARSGGVLLAGTLASNLLSYAFFVVLSRSLDAGRLGAVGSIVNLSVLAGVPALGLQLVGARLVSHAGTGRARTVASGVLRFSTRLGLGVAALLAAASPAVAHLLDLDVALVLTLAATMVPITVTFACQGLLQGAERFAGLALVLGASGVAKFLAAWGSSWFGGDVAAVVVLFGLGWVAVAALGLAVVRRGLGRPDTAAPSSSSSSDAAAGPAAETSLPDHRAAVGHLGRLVAAAVVPTSGLLFLSSVDVLLARIHLDADASGAYTVGALFEKAAFWGLSFLATLFYPAMARAADRRGAILRALTITAGAGVVGVAVAVLLGGPLVALVGGPAYSALAPLVWRFTLLGVCLALVQVIAYAGLAAASHRMGVAMWVAGGLAVAVTSLNHGDVAAVVDGMLVVAAALVVVGAVIEWRWIRLSPRDLPRDDARYTDVDTDAGDLSARRRARSVRPRR